MDSFNFSKKDRHQMKALGITEQGVISQLDAFKRPAPYLRLKRPCTISDGIRAIPEEELPSLIEHHKAAADQGRCLKFVPASGAATRMFEIPLWLYTHEPRMERNEINLPKGLLKFHRYPDGNRTSFEEHLVEATEYVRDARGVCRLHLTVSPEHREGFERLLEKVSPLYEAKYHVEFQVDFSTQRESSNTIAVDMENRPFRLADGNIHFRPSGHGALIENLNNLRGDIIFIKNIDNIVPDRLKATTFTWKKALAGYLLRVQERIFSYVERLAKGIDEDRFFHEALDFVGTELFLPIPETLRLGSTGEKREFLLSTLNRPLRVCGQVPSLGEPGGGPFWVEGKDRALSMQIVERAQVDPDSVRQQEIWHSATHFNPVDVVCGVRDYRGNPFDLRKYVDPSAIIIAKKSQEGRELKALELPGLWNGAMAHWITLFVEVPLITFSPVKTINDLLREEHQPE